MPACRRCSRDNPADATKCAYCTLDNPFDDVKAVSAPLIRPPAPRTMQRMVLGGILGLVLIIGGTAWAVRHNATGAPLCDAEAVKRSVVEVIHENAVFELKPAVAARFTAATIGTLDRVADEGEGRGARKRNCTAIFLMKLGAADAARVEGSGTRGAPSGLTAAERAGFGRYWHASEQRLEIPVTYAVNQSQSTGNPWDLELGETGVAIIRDVVVALARP